MTKGLRCPNCDTTINRRVVHDWIVNQKGAHLQCKNAFCNTRWKRSTLQANAHQFTGEATKQPAPKPVLPAEVKAAAVVVTPTRRQSMRTVTRANKNDWLRRIRKIARGHAKKHGVVSIDVLRRWADKNNDHPTSSSTWGSVFQPSTWAVVSKMPSSYASSRSRKVSVWALKSELVAV